MNGKFEKQTWTKNGLLHRSTCVPAVKERAERAFPFDAVGNTAYREEIFYINGVYVQKRTTVMDLRVAEPLEDNEILDAPELNNTRSHLKIVTGGEGRKAD